VKRGDKLPALKVVTVADEVLQVEQLIAPAELMAIGEVPLSPAVPTAEIGIALAATASDGVLVELVTVGTSQVGHEPEGAAKELTPEPVPLNVQVVVVQETPAPVKVNAPGTVLMLVTPLPDDPHRLPSELTQIG
jgi:hypothetical protein